MKKSQVVKQKKLHNLALEKALLTHRRRYLPFWVCACICVCRLKFGTYYFVTSFFLAFFQSKLFFNSITGYGYILFEFKMIKPYCWDFSIFPFFFFIIVHVASAILAPVYYCTVFRRAENEEICHSLIYRLQNMLWFLSTLHACLLSLSLSVPLRLNPSLLLSHSLFYTKVVEGYKYLPGFIQKSKTSWLGIS